MLTFFPWLNLRTEIRLPEFELLKFERGAKPAGEGTRDQATIDALLAPYGDMGAPIAEAAIMRLGDHSSLDDLGDFERDEVFLFSEIATFAGLSKREFFGPGFYWNSDAFACIIQRFEAGKGGSAITTRRRDGHNLNYIGADSFHVPRPHHVSANFGVQLDEPLMVALLAARELDSWRHYIDAVHAFNTANTDSNAVSEQMEVVSMVGAFERLFDLRHGKEDELAEEFAKSFVPRKEVPLADGQREVPKSLRKCVSVREAWVRDFFVLRSRHAHGRRTSEARCAWDATEHLLLGSFVFPLLVKCRLEVDGVYRLTHSDRRDIDCFERLASVRLFSASVDQGKSQGNVWNRILGEAALEDLI